MRLLVIRLSSFGDIILTTPLLRCLHEQVKDVHIDFLTKQNFVSLVSSNPHVEYVFAPETSIDKLRSMGYDGIIDLQGNKTSKRLCRRIHAPRHTFDKQDVERMLYVLTKEDHTNHRHVAERYFDAVDYLNVSPDGKGLECYYDQTDMTRILVDRHHKPIDPNVLEHPYVVITAGAQHATKRIPLDKIQYLSAILRIPVFLLGDKEDRQRIKNSTFEFGNNVINLCGKTSLDQVQQIVDHASLAIACDTGIMHVASALQVPTIAIWGSTVPEFGFAPYKSQFISMETDLSCRPCHRFGRRRCPKGHYNCMNQQNWQRIAMTAQHLLTKEIKKKSASSM